MKQKNSANQTVKRRRQLEFGEENLCAQSIAFVGQEIGNMADSLVPAVRSDFERATLLGLSDNERLTLDFGIRLVTPDRDETDSRLSGLVIVELKQARFSPRSTAFLALRAANVRPSGFSKYCSAVTMLLNPPRHRPFSTRLRRMLGSAVIEAPNG